MLYLRHCGLAAVFGKFISAFQHFDIRDLFRVLYIVIYYHFAIVELYGVYEYINDTPPKVHIEQIASGKNFEPS